jgi:3-hydroxybutyrate dehydrogenase
MATHFDFEGQVVLVTGASRGIGQGVARAFVRAGAEVHILASGADVERSAVELSPDRGPRVTGHRCDIADRARVAEVVGGLARIDVLVNNAGLERPTPILEPGEAVEETFRRIIEINVLGTYYVTREAVPRMERGGRIVITASIWGKTGVATFGAYCASKHANIGFMRALAQELAPRGITVNAVCPGWVRTEPAMRSIAAIAAREGRAEDEVLDEIVGAQALAGLMEPDDVAAAYLFLASDAAADITGQTLNVDRGEQMS